MPLPQKKALIIFIALHCFLWAGGMDISGTNTVRKDLLSKSLNPDQAVNKGDSLLIDGFTEEALTYFNAAAKQFKEAENMEGLIRARAGMGHAYFNISAWGNAINTLIETETLADDHLPDNHPIHIQIKYLLARSYNESGINGNTPHLDSANIYYKQALLLRLNAQKPDRLALAENYYRLGSLLFYDLNDYGKSETNLTKAWNIYKSEADTLNVNFGRCNYVLASLSQTLGDLEHAISYATEANRIFSHPKVNKPINALFSKIVLANTYYYENRYQDAINWYEIVIEKAISYYGKDSPFLINFYNNYAAALIATKQTTMACHQLNKAISINFSSSPVDYENLSFSYLHLADCAEQNLRFDSALIYLEQCVTIRKKHLSNNRLQIYQSIRFLGEFYERIDSLDHALQYYQEALQVLFPEFHQNDLASNPDFTNENREDIFFILYAKARTLLKRYYREKDISDLKNAYTLYLTSDRLIDEARNSSFFEESKLLFYELFKTDLDAGILCAYELHTQTKDKKYLKAFYQLVEKNKYMLLLQSLINTEKRSALGIPDSIKIKENELNQKISFLKHRIQSLKSDSSNIEHVTKLNHQLLISTNSRDILRKDLAVAYPDYYNLKYDSTFLSLSDVQEQIKMRNKHVLEYYWCDSLVFILSIHPDEASVKKIPISDKLLKSLNLFASSLINNTNLNDPGEDFRVFVSSAHLLYQFLVAPVIMDKNIGETGHLIIIPDGPLAQLPFEALLTSSVKSKFIDYSGLPYLIKTQNISYAYSLNLLFKQRSNKKNHPVHPLLAMSYSGPTITLSDKKRESELQELPWSEVELRSIGEIMHDGIFLSGDQATESKFKALAPQSRIVHLAIHGIADENNAFNSRLEFKSIGDDTDDGKLYNYELYDINLENTQLAVLSACETGMGKQYSGEGIYSIARAFYYAGCPSIVMSLWKVNDKSTAGLMKLFYENIQQNKPFDTALRDAKRTFLSQAGELEAHPANWASFVVIGKTDQLDQKDHIYKYLILALALILLIALLYYKYGKRND